MTAAPQRHPPPWQLFDALSDEAFAALKSDIRERGVLVPVEVDEQGQILDGHHRDRAWRELRAEGVSLADYPRLVRFGLTDTAKRHHVIALNVYRRHLTGEQRADVLRTLRAEGMTLQQIAVAAGIDERTVRRDLRASPETAHAESEPKTITNARGQRRPATYRPRAPKTALAQNARQLQTVVRAAAAGATGGLPEGIVTASHPSLTQAARDAKRQQARADRAHLPAAIVPQGVILEVGNCRALPLPDAVIDLNFGSPVYGLGIDYDGGDVPADEWETWIDTALIELERVTKPGGRMALNVPLDTTRPWPRPTYAQLVERAVARGWHYRFTIVWDEGNTTKGNRSLGSVNSSAHPHHVAPVEMIVVFSKGDWGPTHDGPDDILPEDWQDWGRTVWRISGESRPWEGHPAAFPEELARRVIQYLSPVGATVLDPWMGSGTTPLVAHRLGRVALGFDISAEYVRSARRRIAAWEVAAP